MKRYALKGINNEAEICAICGKVELKRVMWLVELDSDGNPVGEEIHCGTTCGAKLLGYTAAKINTKVKNFEVDRMRKFEGILAWELSKAGHSKKLSEVPERLPWSKRVVHPAYIEAEKIYAEVMAYVKSQNILIEL